ncbi:MAG: hypothetical protein IH627_16855 [Rubrivivax sp.]|nr:hypothetical protein [Rubrivivax sp.]
MSHWSENARTSANGSMGSGAVDAPVKECIDRTWEPLAETEALPLWELQAEILPDDQADGTADGTPR